MIRARKILVFGTTISVSAAIAILAVRIVEDEAPVEGALLASIRSVVLDENREYLIHLPEGYEQGDGRRYPVLYVLDGHSQSEHTADAATLMARVGLIPPLIVVGVPSMDGDTRNRDYTPPDMRRDTDDASSLKGAADRFLVHLQTELIPRVERDFPTTRPRMLSGWSRGGLFVVYSQLAAPALFDARFAHSPALWRENDLIVGQVERTLAAAGFPESFLYLSLGADENEKMTAAFQHLIGVLRASAPPTLRWRADVSLKGTHDSNSRLSTPVGLCAMFNAERPCGPSHLARPSGSTAVQSSSLGRS